MTLSKNPPAKIGLNAELRIDTPPNLKSKAIYVRQLGMMLASELPMSEALSSAQRAVKNEIMRRATEVVKEDVQSGTPFALALSRHPRAFDHLTLAFVRTGEESGEYAPQLIRLSELYKWQLEIKNRIKKATTYPALVLIASLGVLWGLMTFIVPQFGTLLSGLKVPMPPLTAAMLAVSKALSSPLVVGVSLAVLVAGWLLWWRWVRTPAGKARFDAFTLKLPLIGPLTHAYITARVARSMASMLANEVGQLRALELAGEVAGNAVFRRVFDEARTRLQAGVPMWASFLAFPEVIPEDVTYMIRNGEMTGRLKESLDFAADLYDDQVTTQVESLTTYIEPILTIFLGIVVLIVTLSIFLPLFSMVKALS